jgi:hypothetical protein
MVIFLRVTHTIVHIRIYIFLLDSEALRRLRRWGFHCHLLLLTLEFLEISVSFVGLVPKVRLLGNGKIDISICAGRAVPG